MGKIYYRPTRLDRSKISIGKLVEKKMVNYRCSRNVKAWNTHALQADSNGNPPPKELTQAGSDSTFTVEITYSATEAGWNGYITKRNRTDFKEEMELTSYKQDPAAVTHTLEGLRRWSSWTITSAPVLSGSATRKIKRIGALSFLGIGRKAKIEQRESVQTDPYSQYTP